MNENCDSCSIQMYNYDGRQAKSDLEWQTQESEFRFAWVGASARVLEKPFAF